MISRLKRSKNTSVVYSFQGGCNLWINTLLSHINATESQWTQIMIRVDHPSSQERWHACFSNMHVCLYSMCLSLCSTKCVMIDIFNICVCVWIRRYLYPEMCVCGCVCRNVKKLDFIAFDWDAVMSPAQSSFMFVVQTNYLLTAITNLDTESKWNPSCWMSIHDTKCTRSKGEEGEMRKSVCVCVCVSCLCFAV